MQEHLIVTLDGKDYLVEPGKNLLAFIKEQQTFVPSICYNESLGPIQTCDTCAVEIDGKIERACGTTIDRSMVVNTQGQNVQASQKEALDRILESINCIVQCVIIITATVKFIIRWTNGVLNIRRMNISRNLMK
ncbi:formate dehydrogenase subunit alpha [Staphylococcus agnetis]|nr:formate dehydrogenase subunit alpha [Staphylococcus agnetis]